MTHIQSLQALSMKNIIIKAVSIGLLVFLRYNVEHWVKPIGLEAKGLNFLDHALGFLYFILILSFVRDLLAFWYRKRKDLTQSGTDNIIVGVNNIYALLVVITGVLAVLGLFEINVRELFASLSIIAAAIAIISKDYISNLIGGMLITFSNNISVGDHVKVGNNKGRVLDISISMFSLLTDDDDVVTLPNSMVYASEIINYTKRVIKKTSIEFEISLGAVHTVKQLEQDLINSLAEYQDSIKEDSYHLKAVSIKKDAVDFKFQYVLEIPDRYKEQEIRKKVIRRVVQIIKQIPE